MHVFLVSPLLAVRRHDFVVMAMISFCKVSSLFDDEAKWIEWILYQVISDHASEQRALHGINGFFFEIRGNSEIICKHGWLQVMY